MKALYGFQAVLFAIAPVVSFLAANRETFELTSSVRSLGVAAVGLPNEIDDRR